MKKYKSYLLFLIGILMLLCVNVNAKSTYDLNFKVYNITSEACNMADDYGSYDCFLKYLDGDLEDYLLENNGNVEPGQTLMVVPIISPADGSTLINMLATIKTDSTKLTQLRTKDADGEDAGIIYLTADLGIDYDIYPYKTSKGKKTTTWGGEPLYNYIDTETISVAISDSQNASYLVNDAPLSGIFYTVNSDITPGSSISISFDPILEKTNGTTVTTGGKKSPMQPQMTNYTLNVLSNGSISTDNTLSTLTATGNNGLNYPFGFVPSSKKDLEYEFKVPYAVDKITFNGTATDPNNQGIIGLTTHNLNVGDNTITISVTAESGDTDSYIIKVRRLSNDATLSSITGTNGVNFGTLNSTTFKYSTTVPYKTTTTNISVTTSNSEASVPSSEIGNWSITTDNQTNKKNTYNIEVSAEDCKYTAEQVPGNICTKKPYTFEITRTAPSKDLTLSDLKVDGVTVPGFTPSKKEYTLANVAANKTNIIITATLNDSKNSITSGTGTKTVNVGDNKYEIIITSEDGETTDKYTINLYRLSAENRLQSLNVTSNPNGTLSPNFNSDLHSPTGEYTYTYAPNVTTINFTATVKDTGKAYVSIIDANDNSNSANVANQSNTATTSFGITTKKVNVIVTAEDGTVSTYVVNLARQKSTNNYLSSLTITPGTINETFSPTKGSYTAIVDPEVTSVTVNAVLADNNATLGTITGNTNFDFGKGNIIEIPVTSESGQKNTYTINVERKKYNIATLDDIRIGYGTDTPSTIANYNKNTLNYNVNVQNVNAVPFDTKNIKIEFDKTNEYSTVTGDFGTKTLNTGLNTFTINVTSQDGSVTNPYVLNIYRNKNSDNATKGVTVAGVSATPVSGEDNVYEVTLSNEKSSVLPSEVIISTADDATLTKPTESFPLSTENVNIYNYSITSEDGTTKNYEIHITREKSSNANITRVDLGIAGDTTPRYCVFNANETSCTIQVPAGTTKYTLSATIDSKATISPANGTEYEMTSAASDSTQTRTLVVTAENDSTKTYSITIERAKSSNANLSNITLTNVTDGKSEPISFTFQESKTSYNITVPSSVEDVLVEAALKDSKAQITTNLSDSFHLDFGVNSPITIRVLAEDGVTDKEYTLNITRNKGIDTTLKDLKVAGTTISDFYPSKTSYTYSNVSYETTNLLVQGITNDSNAKISEILVNGKPVSITSTNDVLATINLNTGTNTIIVRVKAHDENINSRDYTITVNRDKNTDNSINGIKFKKKDGSFITATVNPTDLTKYIVTVPNNETVADSNNIIVDLPSGQTATDPLATIIMTSTNLVTNDPVTSNVNTHTFTVTAEDGTSQSYTLEITREKNNNVGLTRVYVYADGSSSYASFCENITSTTTCKLTVPVSTTSFSLEGMLEVTTSSVVFKENGVEKTTFDMSSNQSGSSKNIIATVTAEDGTTQNYNIIVERTLSSNAALKKLETDANNEGTLNLITGYTDTKTSYELDLTANPFTQNTFKVNIEAYDSKSKITSISSTATISNTTQSTPNIALLEIDLNGAGQSSNISFTVEAEDGTQIPYTIKINRPKNKEPRLSGITIDNVDINNYLTSPITFDNDSNKDIENTQYVYDLDFTSLHSASSTITDKTLLPNSYHTLNIQATKMDSAAGNVESNGSFEIQTIRYQGNTNYINQVKLISCAQDDSICKTYTLNIRRQPSSNTDLSDWDTAVKVSYIDSGATEATLHNATYDRTQSAGKNNRVYTITVPNSVTEINNNNLIVSVADGLTEWDQKATIDVSTTELSTTTIPNIVNFTVEAEDGTTENYTLQVTREKSDFAALASLSIVNPETNQVIGTFNKTFKEDTNVDAEYTINIPEGTNRYKIVATASNNGTVTGDGTFDMISSTEIRTVYAHSESSNSTTTYKLTIVRSSNDNKNLASLVVEDENGNTYDITPDVITPEGVFSGIYDYSVTVPGSVEKVTVTATPESPLAQGINYIGADASTINIYSVSVGDNIVRFNVRSEAGNEQSYTLKVIREQKNENRLKTLSYTLSNGTAEMVVLEDNKFDYTIPDVQNDITTIYLAATKMDNDSTITGLGQHAIATGPNKFTIKVKAQNGDEQEYTISVNRAKSDDARLKIFSLTGSMFNEAFVLGENNTDTVVYTVTVPETKEKVGQNDITAVPNHSKATIEYDPEINLSTSGINFYGVTVKAEDGKEKRYEIRITRPKSTDATLKAVELEGATIQPDFNPTTNEYTITVPVGKTDFTITGIPNVDIATVIGNGTHSISENSFNIMVQAEDPDVSINTYIFNIVQAKSTDATLSSLGVQGYPITPTFVKTTTSYTIGNIETSVSQVIMNAVPTNIDSTVEYYSDGELVETCESNVKCTISLKPGLGTKYLIAKVTAPDGVSHKEYNISYTKVNSSDALLDNITADAGTFDKEFNQATTDYTLKLPNEISSVNLTITTSQSDASIKVNTDEPVYSPKLYHVSDIPAGESKAVTILVTAQDGTTTKTYNISVEREAYSGSNDAFLSALSVTGHNFTSTFNPSDLDYSIGKIPYTTPTLTINATPNVEDSTIEYFVNGVKQTSNVVDIPKESATVSIKVTAGDKSTVKTYTIDFTKQANNNAKLTNIIVSKGTLVPEFSSEKYSYTVELTKDDNSIDLTAIASDNNATITINGENYISNRLYSLTNLPSGQKEVTIIVTAEDGTTTLTYKVNIKKPGDTTTEVITSKEYGHTITDNYIMTVAPEKTALDMKNQLDNDNSKLEIWNAEDKNKLRDSDTIGTGMIVKLIVNGKVVDSKIIIIKGDTTGDGVVDIFDSAAVLNHYVDRKALEGAYFVAGDTTGDNAVDIFDSAAILNHYVGRTSLTYI